MRMLISGAVALAVLAGVAAPAKAESGTAGYYNKQKKKHRAFRAVPERRTYQPESPYYEHLADKLPIGSSRWFEQMEREGRFGNRGG
jgi:hypothetical protein